MKSITETNKEMVVKQKKILNTRALTVIGMLSALAAVLMLFQIPLWFAPSFYEVDLSEVPILIGAFALGPLAGIMAELVKILLNLIFNGTKTAGVGELANFIMGCSLVVPSAIIYKRRKSRKTAYLGMIIGILTMVIVASLLNAYVLLPVYAKAFGMPLEGIIGFGTAVNPSINNLSTFILFAVMPFNLIKGIVVAVVTGLLYNKISPIIKAIARHE